MPTILRQPSIKIVVACAFVLFLQIQPNWTPLLRDLAVARSSTTLTASSYAAIADAYARQPWNASRAESAGLAALGVGDYTAAQAALEDAVAINGWTPELHIALGDVYKGIGDSKSALAEWEAALPDRPADPNLLTRLAVAYETADLYPQAVTALSTLVGLQSGNAVAQYRLGVLLSVIDPPSAPSHLALAAAVDPAVQPFADSLNQAITAGLDTKDSSYMAAIVGYTLIGLKEYRLAKESLLNAVSGRPDFAEAYAYLGLAEDRLGNDGTYAYDRALSIDEKLPLVHYLLGLHYRRAQDNDKAIAELQRAFELDPSNAAAAAELGSAFTEQADFETAEIWYTQAVNVAPRDATFWTLLANFYLDHGLKVETTGLLAAEKAAELAPGSAEAHDAVGFGEYLNRRFDLAEKALLQAQSIDPQSARVYYHLGLVYVDTARIPEAKQALQTAVALDPGGPVATLALQTLARLGSPS